MHRVLSSQCGLCQFPIQTPSHTNTLRWCEHCLKYLTPVKRCQRCGLSLQKEEMSTDSICGECLSEPPPWQRLYTLGDYDFPLSREVQRFKDHGESWHVKALTEQLAQRGNTKTSREQNLKGAFILNKQPHSSHVAIVDDVVTTGSTVRQLCHLLLEVGVESIDIYCICRTPAPRSL